MDKKLASNVVVGIFVTLGFVLLLFVLFSIGDGRGFMGNQGLLYGKFRQVKGLHFGSEVSLSGLRIGTVKNISIDKEDPKSLVVEFGISREHWDRIRKDSIATIKTQGILGDKYIEISIGSPELPALEHKNFIATQEPEDILTKGGTLVEEIAKQFKGGDTAALLKYLHQTSKNLALMTSELRNAHTDLKVAQSVAHIEAILRKIDKGEGTLGALVNDPTVYEDLKSIMGGAKRSTVVRYFVNQFIESSDKKTPPKGPVEKK